MPLGYGYEKRDPEDQQLNWAEIGKNVSNMLTDEAESREKQKSEINAATREYQKILNNVPQGENTELNKFALDAAADLQKQMLMQETLLKSGQLKPKDYTLMRQNLVDGTDQTFGLLDEYNAEYDKKMAMMDPNLPVSQQASEIQNWLMSNAEGFSNFRNSKLVINPQTGLMSIGKIVDGQVSSNPNDLATVQQLRNRIKGTYNQYDVIGNAENWVESLGEEKKVIQDLGNTGRAGVFKEISDIRSKGGGFDNMSPEKLESLAKDLGVEVSDIKSISKFQEAQNNWIKSQLDVGGTASASVILDFLGTEPNSGKDYEPTFNPDDLKKGDHYVLLKSENGRIVPELSEVQTKRAEEALRAQVDIGLDYKEKTTVSQVYKTAGNRTASQIKSGELKDRQDSLMTAVSKLWYGDGSQLSEGANILKAINKDITVIDRAGDAVKIKFKNGSIQTIPFKVNDQVISQEEFVKSATNFFLNDNDKIADLNKVYNRVGIDNTRQFNEDSKLNVATEEEVKEPINDAYLRVLNEGVKTEDVLVLDDEDETIEKLGVYLKSLPGLETYNVDTDDSFGNRIVIKDVKGKVVAGPFELDSDDIEGVEKEDKLNEYLELIHQLASNVATSEEKGLKIQGKRRSTTERASIKGFATDY